MIGAVPILAAQTTPPGIDRALVARHDESVERLMRSQITDPKSRWRGAVPDGTGLHLPHSAGSLAATCAVALLQPASRFHKSAQAMQRIQLAVGFLERSQTPDGNIDLLTTNFNSPPDTGFVVHGVASAACLAQRAGNRELLSVLQPFLTRAGAGMAKGGVHTPNHRWVICSALAQIHEVFPHLSYPRRIDQWLAEGIDIDSDGQYTERSTGVYNTVCNRAFVTLAAKLNRPELLDPVRRNLDSMLYLLHPGYEVVTEISRRQDQYDRADMGGYWFPLQYLAVRDSNGRYAAIARHFAPTSAGLAALMEYPELNNEVAPAPVPDDYEKAFPALMAVRFRRGPVSATLLLAGDSHFFSYRRGGAVIQSVRFASAFFGKGQFVPSEGRRIGSAYELTQSLEGPYYQPLDPPEEVPAGAWGRFRDRRKRTEICRLTQSATVSETRSGFRLRLRAAGTAGVPVTVEIGLRAGGKLEGNWIPAPGNDGGSILRDGFAIYRAGSDSVRFGPGLAEHSYTIVRGAATPLPGSRVYFCGLTPFDHEVEIG
jgi:hypothetical protein